MDRREDESWKNAEGSWGRLRWARLRKFHQAKDAAIMLNENEGTYRSYERPLGSSKHTPLPWQKAQHFGKRLGVRWEWLLYGEGTPWLDPDPLRERLMLVFDNAKPEQREAVVDAIERLLKQG